jgi:hypothetical protein
MVQATTSKTRATQLRLSVSGSGISAKWQLRFHPSSEHWLGAVVLE